MPLREPQITKPCAALLHSTSVPTDLQGAARVIPILLKCIQTAANSWPEAPIQSWLNEIHSFEKWQRKLAASNDPIAVRHVRPPPESNHFFHAFVSWRPAISSVGFSVQLDALLGRAVLTAAQTNSIVSTDLISGLNTLRLTNQGKGTRSKDWTSVLNLKLLDLIQLIQARELLGVKSPCFGFLNSAISAIGTTILDPLPVTHVFTETTETDQANFDKENSDTTSSLNDEPVKIAKPRDQDPEPPAGEESSTTTDAIADVKARLAAADYSTVPEKLGIYHRDQLLLNDLCATTHRVQHLLHTGNRIEQGFALVALVGLVTCTSDIYTLALPLQPNGNIWIDLGLKSWAWDFSKYRKYRSPDEQNEMAAEPIFVPMPVDAVDLLLGVFNKNPSAINLEELVIALQKCNAFDLKGYRRFLRSLGNTAHPAHRGRFSRSMLGAYLEVTGSDMTAALMTAQFTATAPAALFYFGPTFQTIYDRTANVYLRLGLGPHSRPYHQSARTGCRKIVEPKLLQPLWGALIDEINTARQATLRATDLFERSKWATKWMAHLCAAFVVQSAHRGTRFDCLTFSALYSAKMMGVIHDKDDTVGDRSQPRLIPWTSTLRSILSAVIECHNAMRLHCDNCTNPISFEGEDPVFVSWSVQGLDATAALIQPSAVAAVIHTRFVGSEVNVGRSIWVTALDAADTDRWLIRSLTGHTRDVTRTSGPYFDVPCHLTAERLGRAMENVGGHWFGNATPEVKPTPFLVSNKFSVSQSNLLALQSTTTRVPDPRTLLAPLSPDILNKWRHGKLIREHLAAGRISASPAALAVLHLLFLDLLPNSFLAFKAVADRKTCMVSEIGGLLVAWERPHFIHPTLLPVLSSTQRLIEKIECNDLRLDQLLVDVCISINAWFNELSSNIKTPISWMLLCDFAQAFRRLELPPSLLAASSVDVPAPCLSLQSLIRLAGIASASHVASHKKPSIQSRQMSPRGADIVALATKLNKYVDQAARLGERRKRAIDCGKEIEELSDDWSEFGSWLRNWVLEEIHRLKNNEPYCYQLSSLSTYFSTLSLQSKHLERLGDPYEWEEQEWDVFLDQTNQSCRSSNIESPEENSQLHPRIIHAASALTRSLTRRQCMVPHTVLRRLSLEAEAKGPFDSASSVLVTPHDRRHCVEITERWCAERPVDRLLASIRFTSCDEAPVRSGDVSSLASDCTTPGGGLVFRRMGYNIHKTDDAIRVVQISSEGLIKFNKLSHQLKAYRGEQPLLLRGDGSQSEGLRDKYVTELCGQALKLATGDPKARMHSLRGATLQELAWPGWQDIGRKILSRQLPVAVAVEWVLRLASKWTGLATATSKAGQSDLRSAFGNYLAGWPIIHTAICIASLEALTTGPALIRQLGINPDALRKARSRHKVTTDGKVFNEWDWIQGQCITSNPVTSVKVAEKQPIMETSESILMPSRPAESVPLILKATYLTVRALGLSQPAAIHATGITFSGAVAAEYQLPGQNEVSLLTRRARQSVQPRGSSADVGLTLSDRGRDVFNWISSLNKNAFEFLHCAFMREHPVAPGFFDNFDLWATVCQDIPANLSLSVRRGTSHVTREEVMAALKLGEKMQLQPDPRLGNRPKIRVQVRGLDNRVESARITSVTGVAILAIAACRNMKGIQIEN